MPFKILNIIKKILIGILKFIFFPYFLYLNQFNCDEDDYWKDKK